MPPPLGAGPIERLFVRRGRGEISLAYALEQARSPTVVGALTLPYAQELGAFAYSAVQGEDRAQAVELQQLALAAAEQLPDDPDADEIGARVRKDWIEVVKTSLAVAPDGRLFESALDAARWLLGRGERTGLPQHVWEGRFYHGTLHLDPYTAGKSPEMYRHDLVAWHRRLANELGAAAAFEVERAHPMPAPEVALNVAAESLRAAAEVASGRPRGGALKALVQTLYFRAKALGLPIDEEELRTAGLEVLRLLPPDHPGARETALYLRARKVEVPRTASAGSGARPAGASGGPLDRAHALLTEANTLASTDPSGALELLRRAYPEFQGLSSEIQKRRVMAMIGLLGFEHGERPFEEVPLGGARTLADELERRAAAERWTPRRLAGALFAVAARTGAGGEERVGLELLDRAEQLDPAYLQENLEAVTWQRAALWDGEGANCANSDRPAEGIEAYGEAARQMFSVGSIEGALKALAGIEDLVARSGEDVPGVALPQLGSVALRAELEGGQRAVELLQSAYRTISGAFGEKLNVETVATLSALAKGYAFGAAARSGVRYDFAQDGEALRLLAEIDRREREVGVADAIWADAIDLDPLLREVLLVSYADAGTPRPGSEELQVLQNLQHRFDTHCRSAIISRIPLSAQGVAFDAETRAALDARTVLLDLFLGRGPGESAGVLARLLTQEETEVFRILSRSGAESIPMGLGGREVRMHPIGANVAVLRARLQEDPGAEALGPKAAAALADLSSTVLGELLPKRLASLRDAGKDHLCIVPHGPLHFVPFHLLPVPNGELGSLFTVTSTPTAALVARRSARTPSSRRGAAVFGLSFEGENALELDPIPSARDEADVVARVLGVGATPEEAATKAAVLEALRTRRWVHLATHGAQATEAPMLHEVFLTPGEDDGRLKAYELLREPLDGLEVVTLSACESALGRFDEGDNLRGLPAALLLAGAQNIVGTLWEVEDAAARTFFGAFYARLAAGAPIREAFAAGQRTVRSEFAQARDWAPFYLMEG